MNHVRTVIYNQLNQAHDYPVKSSPVTQGQQYPFTTYKLSPISNTEKDRDDYTLTVSHWDKSESSSHLRVAEMVEKSFAALKGFKHNDEYLFLACDMNPSIGEIPDQDTEIKRYDVTTLVRTYRRLRNG